jgi:hypothetical protein
MNALSTQTLPDLTALLQKTMTTGKPVGQREIGGSRGRQLGPDESETGGLQAARSETGRSAGP